MHRQQLLQTWSLVSVSRQNKVRLGLSATVPGSVHSDLFAAHKIPDPNFASPSELAWVSHNDWQYQAAFEVEADFLEADHLELVCEGLDTVTYVNLNGIFLGETANMHHPHRFSVKPYLRLGENILSITFISPLNYVDAMEAQYGPLPHQGDYGFNYIRKMVGYFGQFGNPEMVSMGVWRPVYLHAWNVARLETVRPLVTRADETEALVEVHVTLTPTPSQTSLRVTLGQNLVTQVVPPQTEQVSVEIRVAKPKLWWPIGYGEQNLYDLALVLTENDSLQQAQGAAQPRLLDTWQGRIGLRSVELNTAADDIGSPFTLHINGQPIFCKGANWVPVHQCMGRVSQADYRSLLEQAVEANFNMLRVWAGGIYEQESFYRLCDELGLLVWQDFPFVGAAYPETTVMKAQVETEARYQISRLSQHPSLVLWNGCSDNLWTVFEEEWPLELGERGWGLHYYLEQLPALLAELDPTRPYWPGSPYSGSLNTHPLSDDHGPTHLWQVWHQLDYAAYRQHPSRFCSQFGYYAPPTPAVLTKNRSLSNIKAQNLARTQTLEARLSEHFNVPQNNEAAWLYLSQLNQARAVQAGVDFFRTQQPRTMGALFWHFNEPNPAISGAAVDASGQPKLLWFASRHFFAARRLILVPDELGLALYANNDTAAPWLGEVLLKRLLFNGDTFSQMSVILDAAARQNRPLHRLPALTRPDEFIVAELRDDSGQVTHRACWFSELDRNLPYPEPQFSANLTPTADGYQLTLRAETLLRDVALFPQWLDPTATVSQQLITLLPGEQATFELTTTAEMSLEALTNQPVFQCVNWYGRGYRLRRNT